MAQFQDVDTVHLDDVVPSQHAIQVGWTSRRHPLYILTLHHITIRGGEGGSKSAARVNMRERLRGLIIIL